MFLTKKVLTTGYVMKKFHRVHYWSDYNQSLVQRGSINLWIDEAVVDPWFEPRFKQQKVLYNLFLIEGV